MATPYTAEMAHAAVERGAVWLDQMCSRWFEEIDLIALNLADPQVCILGQTSDCLVPEESDLPGYLDPSRYYRVVAHYGHAGGNESWPVSNGFDIPCNSGGTGERFARYEMLTLAWRTYIRARLEALVPA